MKCPTCYGKGRLPTTGSAMFWPDRFPDEFKKCVHCNGLGKVSEQSQAYGIDCKGGVCE